MERAAIVIGVDRAGDLPVLSDAAKGAERFAQWAREQQFSSVELMTDKNEPVEISAVSRKIRQLINAGRTEQLVVYFAGHGVNIHYGEYWLLSDAPRDANAAVNVRGSEALARYAGIPHVIFFSDACRTAAQGIQAQGISGGEIFPNDPSADTEKPIDQFFACTLGRPALEVPDKAATAREFKALYTTALLAGLHGEAPMPLEWKIEDYGEVAYVCPRPLRDYLRGAMAELLKSLNLSTKAIQIPDARIVSDPPTWIARLMRPVVVSRPQPKLSPLDFIQGLVTDEPPRASPRPRRPRPRQPLPATPATVSASLLQSAIEGGLPQLDSALANIPAGDIADVTRETAASFGPDHFETDCGFKIRGAGVVEAFSLGAETNLFERPGNVVQIKLQDGRSASVLLVLNSGASIVLPAIPYFITALTVKDDELVDVAFEPIGAPPAEMLKALHAVASASTRDGVFRLERNEAERVADELVNWRGEDPALAIYAAYAYDDLGRRGRIAKTAQCIRNRLAGAQLFDIALLAGELDGKVAGRDPKILGFAPLLSQGWALLAARRISLPDSLGDIRRNLWPSVWTMFNSAAIGPIQAAMQRGDVR
jgi:hypothetical protein